MLSKYRLLATLLLLCSICSPALANKGKWETVHISALINSEVYLSAQRWRLTPTSVIVPGTDKASPQSACYAPRMEQFLQEKLLGKALKVRFVESYSPTQIYREAQIKFDGKHDLSEFLLKQGWAVLPKSADSVDKTYQQAEKEAKMKRKGFWGECDEWYKVREKLRLKGVTSYMDKDKKHYLAPVSVAWVHRVLSPTVLEMNDGQKIKLQALKTPKGESPLRECWSNLLVLELESLLLGKKVRLEADQLNFTAKGRHLQRYVWLDSNRWQPSIFINQYLIEQNWAQLEASELNLKYVSELEEADKRSRLKTVPPEWWHQCFAEIAVLEEQEPKGAVVKFDDECPIKGNISGSKKAPKKTYHTPASGWYKRITAEQCFADEAAAQAEGFIKVK